MNRGKSPAQWRCMRRQRTHGRCHGRPNGEAVIAWESWHGDAVSGEFQASDRVIELIAICVPRRAQN